jgi:hypothetical protein
VEFLHVHAKIPDYRGSLCSLSGIKIHFREFLYNFALKRNKLLEDAYGRAEEIYPFPMEQTGFPGRPPTRGTYFHLEKADPLYPPLVNAGRPPGKGAARKEGAASPAEGRFLSMENGEGEENRHPCGD